MQHGYLKLISHNLSFHFIGSGIGKDPQSTKLEFWGDIPRLTITGKYTAKGNVLILPIVGNGNTNITLGKKNKLPIALIRLTLNNFL